MLLGKSNLFLNDYLPESLVLTFLWDIGELIFGGEIYIAEATNFRQPPQHYAQFICEKCKEQLEVGAKLNGHTCIVRSEIRERGVDSDHREQRICCLFSSGKLTIYGWQLTIATSHISYLESRQFCVGWVCWSLWWCWNKMFATMHCTSLVLN